jgi:CDGSH-type Zn-finger protein
MEGKPEGSEVVITVRENGGYLVRGPVRVVDVDGNEYDLSAKKNVVLCRCGGSVNKPFCDGTHSRIGFQGAERAVRRADSEKGLRASVPVGGGLAVRRDEHAERIILDRDQKRCVTGVGFAVERHVDGKGSMDQHATRVQQLQRRIIDRSSPPQEVADDSRQEGDGTEARAGADDDDLQIR